MRNKIKQEEVYALLFIYLFNYLLLLLLLLLGSGLGLWISQEIIRLHDSKITASSPGVGKGMTFSFELPIDSIQELSSCYSRLSSNSRHTSISQSAGEDEINEMVYKYIIL